MTRPPKPAQPAPASSWEEEIRSVRPLGSKAPPPAAKPKMPPATGPGAANPPYTPKIIGGWNTHPPFPVASNTATLICGHDPHMDKQAYKQLSTGKLRPTAVLDLHGLGEGDAWLELVDFLHAAAAQDHRTALIIHGKGTGYGPCGTMGVIKAQIAGWLAGHPKVLAFHTAQPHDGGTGALYAYLRRH